ncbi:MAG: phosphate signaling complex protein PhoU [Candidatus Omnitrophota bacterium]
MSVHLQREIEHLMAHLIALSATVEYSLKQAIQSLVEKDIAMARQVIGEDHAIDVKELEIEEECLKILALYQPVAKNLRYLVAVLKINNDLERVGDLAQNIAYNAIDIIGNSVMTKSMDHEFVAIHLKAESMFKKSLDCIINLDLTLAREILKEDDEMDRLRWKFESDIVNEIKTSPEKAAVLVEYIAIVRDLERIADHATNIAEDVIYLKEGEIVRHGGLHEES